MTTIYKAIPGETEINITYLDDNLRFVGNDAKVINIGEVEYGSILTLEDVDSLEEIHVEKPGSIIYFNRFPEQTIRIKGSFEEIRVKDKNDYYNLHRFASNPTLPLGGFLWGAIVTRDHNIKCGEMDALMIKPQEVSELKIDGEWSHISVIGDKHLDSITVTGSRIIRNFVVHRGPVLTSLNIRRRALTCSLLKSPNVDTIIGFGDRLNLQPKPRKKNSLSIGGFWQKVPEWYDLQVAQLQVPHFKAHLTANDIISCKDMGGITIIPHNYEGKGGLCHFSSTFDVSVEELSFGIEISQLIHLIEQNSEEGFEAFSSWCEYNLSLFDQYKAMRIIASLISRGFNPKHIIKMRNALSEMNTSMPKLIIGSVNDGNQGGKWNPMYSGESDEWEIPNNSVMPFGRVDLEIWLNTNLGVEFLGMEDNNVNFQPRHLRRRHLGENKVVRNLLISTLSAANTVGRDSHAERKLVDLAESLYTNPKINTDPFCCEFTVFHLGNSRVATKPIIGKLIDGIASMQTASWKKAALLIGVVERTNSSRARMVLKRIASDKEFDSDESAMINAISIAGQRAFNTGKSAPLRWPYLRNWQKRGTK